MKEKEKVLMHRQLATLDLGRTADWKFIFLEIRVFSKIDILSVDAPKVLG